MSIQVIRELSADVVKRGATRAVYAKQNDVNSRFLNVRIQEEGKDIKVDPTLKVLLNVERTDKTNNIFYGTVNEDGSVQIPLTAWMLELEGTLVCDISLVSEDTSVAKLTTMQFNIYVEAAVVGDNSFVETEEYSVIVDLLNRTTAAEESARKAAIYAEQVKSECEDATAEANKATAKVYDTLEELEDLEGTFCKKNPQYRATPETLLEVIGSAEAGATIQLAAGEYPLLKLHGKDTYPENLTIVGDSELVEDERGNKRTHSLVTMSGVSITSGVLDIELGGRADDVNSILPRGLTFKTIRFTNDFSLRNAAIDDLRFDGCNFRDVRINIAPDYMYDEYGNDWGRVNEDGSITKYPDDWQNLSAEDAAVKYPDFGEPINRIRRYQVGLHMKNFVIRKCEIEDVSGVDATAVLVKGIDGIYIEDNWIKNVPYNAIQITGMVSADMYNSGVISVAHNQIINTGNRSIRIAYAKDAAICVCSNILFSANKNSANTDVIKVSDCINSTYMFATNRYEDVLIDENDEKIVVADCTSYPANTAPAGYGLGTTGLHWRDSTTINSTVLSGWYHYYEWQTRLCGVTFNHANLFVYYYDFNATSCVQELRPLGTNVVLRRCLDKETWTEWEIENPPMVSGVEYRTTERFNNNPVYCQMVTIHDLSANSTKIKLTDDYGVKQTGLIRYTGNVWDGNASVIYWMPGNEASLSYKNGAFYLEGHDVNITHYHATLTLYYIKN